MGREMRRSKGSSAISSSLVLVSAYPKYPDGVTSLQSLENFKASKLKYVKNFNQLNVKNYSLEKTNEINTMNEKTN